jgi:uncharacterized alpha-E superfamily protein
MSLRVFAARTQRWLAVMPGGFARVGSSNDTSAIAMQRGGQAADVWVVSDKPVSATTLLPRGDELARNPPGSLPSRAADNFFWLGRYASSAPKATHAHPARLAMPARRAAGPTSRCSPMRAPISKRSTSTAAKPCRLADLRARNIDSACSAASQHPRPLLARWLAGAERSAEIGTRLPARVQPGDDARRAMTVLLRKLAGFSGLVHENMYRFAGWRFLELGRRLERAIQLARIVAWFVEKGAPEGSLEMLLEIGDSVMSHRRRYSVSAGTQSAIDMLVLDPLNPRSVIFQLAEIREQIETLPGGVEDGVLSPAAKLALSLHTRLTIAEPHKMTSDVLEEVAAEIEQLANVLTGTYFG